MKLSDLIFGLALLALVAGLIHWKRPRTWAQIVALFRPKAKKVDGVETKMRPERISGSATPNEPGDPQG